MELPQKALDFQRKHGVELVPCIYTLGWTMAKCTNGNVYHQVSRENALEALRDMQKMIKEEESGVWLDRKRRKG